MFFYHKRVTILWAKLARINLSRVSPLKSISNHFFYQFKRIYCVFPTFSAKSVLCKVPKTARKTKLGELFFASFTTPPPLTRYTMPPPLEKNNVTGSFLFISCSQISHAVLSINWSLHINWNFLLALIKIPSQPIRSVDIWGKRSTPLELTLDFIHVFKSVYFVLPFSYRRGLVKEIPFS